MAATYEFPEESELIVCTVTNVKSFGAFVTLDEYDNKEGFIHVAEVATGWVKYIRDHVREGQKIVCKVLHVDESKGHIDLSLKQVNEHQKRDKIQLWKNEAKADRLLTLVAEEMKIDLDTALSDFGVPLIEYYGTLYGAFEKASMGAKRLEKDGFKGDYIATFVQVAEANITPPHVKVMGMLELTHPGGNGINDIMDAIKEMLEVVDNEGVKILYLGAPRYRIEVIAEDYKDAEAVLKESVDSIVATLTDKGGKGTFARDQ